MHLFFLFVSAVLLPYVQSLQNTATPSSKQQTAFPTILPQVFPDFTLPTNPNPPIYRPPHTIEIWQLFLGTSMTETPLFSEEQGSSGPITSLIAGLECQHTNCDNKKLFLVNDLPYTRTPVIPNESVTDWFSEEATNFRLCPENTVVSEIWCSGRYCDNMRLGCGGLVPGYQTMGAQTVGPVYSGRILCPSGSYIQGIGCFGRWCQGIKLWCVDVATPSKRRPPLVQKCPREILSSPNSHLTLTNSFSDENGGFSQLVQEPVHGVRCSGRYCDNKNLVVLRGGLTNAMVGDVQYTHWFSEEGTNHAFCPDNMLMAQMQCSGRYCDSLRLGCRPFQDSYKRVQDDVKATHYFSDENGQVTCPPGYFVYGVACSGRYCDNIQLHCVRLECA